jgi:multiple sugar transport system substrate-binding protein
MLAVIVAAVAVVIAACGGSGDDKSASSPSASAAPASSQAAPASDPATSEAAPASDAAPATDATAASEPASTFTGEAKKITLWVPWSDRELSVFEKVVGDYDAAHPEVEVKLVGGVNDDKILQSMRAGDAADVVASFDSANVGKFCESGGWIDLKDNLAKDGIDVNIFPATTRYYTSYKDKQCALPILADAYGLYFNKDLFAKAGLSEPPKTVQELMDYAKKLTVKKPDGSLEVVGFDPFFGFFQNTAQSWAPLWGAKWIDDQGKSTLATNPAWTTMLTWQKELIDFYGYDNLVKWQAGVGDEFSPQNAFETGKLAMNYDGEWRTAFIKNETPDLNYGTAPAPTSDPSLYGAGSINGTIIGMPDGSDNPDEAWALLKYLTTDDKALTDLANGLGNVPSTTTSSQSPDLQLPEQFSTFLDVFNNPNSDTPPITAVGNGYQQLMQSFLANWQAGKVDDLANGLADVDNQIDAQLEQANGGGAP